MRSSAPQRVDFATHSPPGGRDTLVISVVFLALITTIRESHASSNGSPRIPSVANSVSNTTPLAPGVQLRKVHTTDDTRRTGHVTLIQDHPPSYRCRFFNILYGLVLWQHITNILLYKADTNSSAPTLCLMKTLHASESPRSRCSRVQWHAAQEQLHATSGTHRTGRVDQDVQRGLASSRGHPASASGCSSRAS